MNCDKDRPPQKHYVLQLLFNSVALSITEIREPTTGQRVSNDKEKTACIDW